MKWVLPPQNDAVVKAPNLADQPAIVRALLAQRYADSHQTTDATGTRRGIASRKGARGAKSIGAGKADSDAVAQATEFLDAKTQDYETFMAELMPKLKKMPDFEEAAQRLADAVMKQENIGISGDYDCDGNCSVAVMCRFLMESGVPIERIFPHIPNRALDGYGINEAAVEQMKSKKINLLLTLDNGTLAFEPIKQATTGRKKMDVIVVDHHPNQDGQALPKDAWVVNANRNDRAAQGEKDIRTHVKGVGDLAAVGMTYVLCARATEILKKAKYYGDNKPPNPKDWLGLVALATIGDVVNIRTPINRNLVAHGLQQVKDGRDPYISALLEVAEQNPSPDSESFAFSIAPIINAPGRLGQSVGWSFLSGFAGKASQTSSGRYQEIVQEVSKEIRALEQDILGFHKDRTKDQPAWKLPENPQERLPDHSAKGQVTFEERLLMILSKECNEKRKELEGDLTREARNMAKVELSKSPPPNILFIAGKNWHPGLIGIVAGRLKEQYNMPTVVASIGDDGKCKCSARSIKVEDHPVDLGSAFRELQHEKVLTKGGGHVMAAGASFDEAKLETFKSRLEEMLGKDALAARDASRASACDIIDLAKLPLKASAPAGGDTYRYSMRSAGMQPDYDRLIEAVKQLETLEPYGEGNPRPRVILRDVTVSLNQPSNDLKHYPNLLIKSGDVTIKGQAFHVAGTDVYEQMKGTKPCHLLGSFAIDKNGVLNFRIDDACPASSLIGKPKGTGIACIDEANSVATGIFAEALGIKTRATSARGNA